MPGSGNPHLKQGRFIRGMAPAADKPAFMKEPSHGVSLLLFGISIATMPSIAVIDIVSLDDADIKRLKSIGKLSIFRNMPKTEDEIALRIGENEIVITGGSHITKKVIERSKKLKMISIWATGYNNVDVEFAAKRGIVVTNVPGYSKQAVAEHTFALIFSLIRKIPQADKYVKEGKWSRKNFKAMELKGKTIGIIGTGNIGGCVAKLAHCFGMKVIAFTKHPSLSRAKKLGLEYVTLDKLLKSSDIVTIHVSLNPETEKMLSKREFAIMKRGAVLINTARGLIIDERYLIEALQKGTVAGAGSDTLENEPPDLNNQLLKMKNVIITPHCAWYTDGAMERCTDIGIENIEKFLQGRAQNVINVLH